MSPSLAIGQLQTTGRLAPAFTYNPPFNPVDVGGSFGSGTPIFTPTFGPGSAVDGSGISTGAPIFPVFGPGGGGINTGAPIITVGGPGTTTTTTTPLGPDALTNWLNKFLDYFVGPVQNQQCGVGDLLLRIALFILGFICIIAAIYLYKGSNPVLQIPAHVTRGVVRASKRVIEVGAEA